MLELGKSGSEPIAGASERRLDGVPEFVYHNQVLAPNKFTKQMQELLIRKPVIHLYGEEGQKVQVTVRVERGMPVVYYPKPELGMQTIFSSNKEGEFGNLTYANQMTWTGYLTKKQPSNLAEPPKGNWWNATRNIPSDYIQMKGGKEAERFIFYEATAPVGPTVKATVSGDEITMQNIRPEPSAPVVLIINDAGSIRGYYHGPIDEGGTVKISAEDLQEWDEKTLISNCRKQWVACGMTAEEAAGIVDSWRPELLETPGFLFISGLPREIYDSVFPIEVNPKPKELVRVCFNLRQACRSGRKVGMVARIRKEGKIGDCWAWIIRI